MNVIVRLHISNSRKSLYLMQRAGSTLTQAVSLVRRSFAECEHVSLLIDARRDAIETCSIPSKAFTVNLITVSTLCHLQCSYLVKPCRTRPRGCFSAINFFN